METTHRLNLPLLAAGQAQKELYHNSALELLDLAVGACVEDAPSDLPPESPLPGSCYIVGASPSGDWAQYPHHMAIYGIGGWRFLPPRAGLSAVIKSSGLRISYGTEGWEAGVIRASAVLVEGQQVLAARRPAIADPLGGTAVDAEARDAIAQILAALRGHGLVATE